MYNRAEGEGVDALRVIEREGGAEVPRQTVLRTNKERAAQETDSECARRLSG